MGTRPAKPFGEPICNKIELIKKTLEDAGYHVRYYTGTSGKRLLIVNEACTVADNVECDPGQAFNVTAAIDDLDFEEELKIGHLVRSVSVVPRVITFGGRGVHLQNLLDAIEEHGDYIGVNAPASGVYNNDYHCIHMGYGVDPEVQIPTILGKSGLPVFLLGKVADVVTNNYGTSIPMVDTASVLQRTLEIVKEYMKKDMSGGIIHCFSYSREIAAEYLKMGLYLGVGGVLTFKNAKKLKEVAAMAPLSQIVLETDCPYMAPEPNRGKRNSSLNLPYVAEALAQIKGITAEEVIAVTEENAKKLLFK